MSNPKYLKCVLEKGFATTTEKTDKKESWFPEIYLFDFDGKFFDSVSFILQQSHKFFAALIKIANGKDLEGIELIYSDSEGEFLVRVNDRLYFISAPRDFLHEHGVHEYHCENKDIQKYLKTISTQDLLKANHNAIINPENARELISQIKELS